MAETNINVTPGSGGPNIDLEQIDNGNSRQVIVIGDPTASANVAGVDASGNLKVAISSAISGNVTVSNFPATQPISGSISVSNFPATQPVSIAAMPSTPVTGTFFPATQPVSLAVAPTTPVTGTFFQATQPVSAVSLPLPSGAATSSNQSSLITNQTNGTQQTQIVQGGFTAVVDSTGDLQVDVNNPIQVAASNLCQSVTAATGVAVTVTLPAVVGQFHYISFIQIKKYFTVANAASATPLIVTTTNLPGPLAFTFGQPLGTIGSTDEDIFNPNSPLKSSVVNTATTIVCPATTGIIWRVNVLYFTAV